MFYAITLIYLFLVSKLRETISMVGVIAVSFTTMLLFISYLVGIQPILDYSDFYVNDFNIHFLILTNAVGVLVMVLSTRAVVTAHKLFYVFLSLILLCLNLFFMSDNSLSLYIFFEASAAPMFILIGLFGAGATRNKAAYKFILYSLMGSITLLPALVDLEREMGNLSLSFTTSSSLLYLKDQLLMALAFFLPFSIKMPIMPVHLWLPEAHVEAPTAISVLLAGLLLKTGSFAFYLVVIYTFYQGSQFITSLSLFFGLFSVVASAYYALVQTDIKKLIAYSSISHMSLVLLGLFTLNELGFKGGYLFMLAHGITSAALFSIVGVLYDRGHLRIIRAYNGLVLVMPLFVTIFFIMTLGNAGFPFTPGFFAEFLSFAGLTYKHPFASFLAGISVILSLVYSMWCFSRISFGNIHFLKLTQDLEKTELAVLLSYLFAFTLIGFNSDIVLGIVTQPQLSMSNSAVILGKLDTSMFNWVFGSVIVGAVVLSHYKPVISDEKTAGVRFKVFALAISVIYFILQNMYNLACIYYLRDMYFVEYIYLYPQTRPDIAAVYDARRYFNVYLWFLEGRFEHFLYTETYNDIKAADSDQAFAQFNIFLLRSYYAIIKTLPVLVVIYYLIRDLRKERLAKTTIEKPLGVSYYY